MKPKYKIGTLVFMLLLIAATRFFPSSSAEPKKQELEASAEEAKKPKPRPNKKPMTDAADRWTTYEKVTLATHHNNDGDSFWVALGRGQEQEFRLYFVDTPESALKTYQDGNTNHKRVAQQAEYFGGLTADESVALGKKAKEMILDLLSKDEFDVFTRHEEVYDSGRFYSLVQVTWQGKKRWLDEVLVENGMARIITQPSELPDGTSAEKHKQHLRSLEAKAKRAHKGGWK